MKIFPNGGTDDVMDEWLPLFTEEKKFPTHPKERKEFLAKEIIKQL